MTRDIKQSTGARNVLGRLKLRKTDGAVYLDRRVIFKCRWFGIFIHRFDAPDPGLDMHDHPWWFASLILRGGYTEVVDDIRVSKVDDPGIPNAPDRIRAMVRYRRPGSLRSIGQGECHQIMRLYRVPTWTLVIRGPQKRNWGFYEPGGWVVAQESATERRDLYQEVDA